MSNKRITDLTELTTPTTDDVFPIVDIATNTTQKVQVGNLPIQTAVTTALATKQATLVSGTNIKTVNSTSLVGSGNVAVQETLVSGTNIKTLNSVSLLGSGDIVLAATPSGVAGAIQFSNGSAFASDASNLFWDDTNDRLGIGTNAPTENVEVVKNAAANNKLLVSNTNTTTSTARATVEVKVGTLIGAISSIAGSGVFVGSFSTDRLLLTTGGTAQVNIQTNGNSNFGNSLFDLGARVGIKGSGSTSATTSLLVQNSAGTAQFFVQDGGVVQSGLIRLDNNGSGRGRMTGVEQINGTSGAGGTRFCTNPDGLLVNASAQLQVDATDKGFLPPRMTTTQKNAIATPAAGLVVYDNTTNKLCCYNGSTWNDLF